MKPPPELVPIQPDDRGPALFFHGREKQLQDFRWALEDARLHDSGTTYLALGPPGAGKSALLHECMRRAKAEGWRTAFVTTNGLYDPQALAWSLNAVHRSKPVEYAEGEAEGGPLGPTKLSGHLPGGRNVEYEGRSVLQILQAAAGGHGLVFVIDEVQTVLKEKRISTSVEAAITRALVHVHNGLLNAPVVLLAGGLGSSEKVFRGLGISRFMGYGLQRLGKLNDEATESVICEWLVKAGGAPDDAPYLAHWVSSLAAESHGWPQHINVYSRFAAEWLLEHKSEPTPEIPEVVWSQARHKRAEFYLGRVVGIAPKHRRTLANFLRQKAKNSDLEKEELVTALEESCPGALALELFDHLLHRGVIAETPHGYFRVPIPSMHDWLVEQYADRGPQQLPQSATPAPPIHQESEAMEKREPGLEQ